VETIRTILQTDDIGINTCATLTDDQKKNFKGFKKGNIPVNKGLPSGKKGMSYEEIYGPEVAAKMREVRSKKFQ
jgi:hypothetical protein